MFKVFVPLGLVWFFKQMGVEIILHVVCFNELSLATAEVQQCNAEVCAAYFGDHKGCSDC